MALLRQPITSFPPICWYEKYETELPPVKFHLYKAGRPSLAAPDWLAGGDARPTKSYPWTKASAA